MLKLLSPPAKVSVAQLCANIGPMQNTTNMLCANISAKQTQQICFMQIFLQKTTDMFHGMIFQTTTNMCHTNISAKQ